MLSPNNLLQCNHIKLRSQNRKKMLKHHSEVKMSLSPGCKMKMRLKKATSRSSHSIAVPLFAFCMLGLSLQLVLGAAPPALNHLKPFRGPRVEIKPSLSEVMFEAQTTANRVLTCKAFVEKPGVFSELRWSGPDRTDNWSELARRHKVKEYTRDGLSVELEFKNLTSDDSGQYFCSGIYQSDVYNASIKVRVYNPIKLEYCPRHQFIIENETDQKITCRIRGDSPSVVILKDGIPVDQVDPRYKWDSDERLELNGPIKQSDAGTYSIEVTADLTGDRKVFDIGVEVRSRPRFPLSNQSASSPGNEALAASEFFSVEGESKELSCEVSGNPKPSVLWFDPKKRNLTQVGGYHVDSERGTLLIDRVSMDYDNGNFECYAYNSVGDARRNVSMTVLQLPRITLFENMTVEEGRESVLECRATGSPKPKFSIGKHALNAVPYGLGDGNVTNVEEHEEAGGIRVFIYRVKIRASKSNYGLHYCNVTNMAGQSERLAQLTVKHKPDLSQTPSEQYVRMGKNITLTCHIKAHPEPKVTWFTDNNQMLIIESSNFKTSPDGQTHIMTIMPSSSYQGAFARFRCRAENELGEAEQIITPRYTGPPGMVNVAVLETTSTTAKLQLSVSRDGGDRVRGYKYRAVGSAVDSSNPIRRSDEENQNETLIDATPTVAHYTVRNLLPHHRYIISMRAINEVGEGELTEFTIETRKPTQPEPPVILVSGVQSRPLQATSDHSNGYLLKWSPPESDNGGTIQRYRITFHRVNPKYIDEALDNPEERIIEPSDNRPQQAKLGPLETNQYYKIQLQARNSFGDSTPAQIVVYTAPDKPPMLDFGPQVMAWLAEPSTYFMVGVLVVASMSLIIIDLIFCCRCKMGVLHSLKSCCCRSKSNGVLSNKDC